MLTHPLNMTHPFILTYPLMSCYHTRSGPQPTLSGPQSTRSAPAATALDVAAALLSSMGSDDEDDSGGANTKDDKSKEDRVGVIKDKDKEKDKEREKEKAVGRKKREGSGSFAVSGRYTSSAMSEKQPSLSSPIGNPSVIGATGATAAAAGSAAGAATAAVEGEAGGEGAGIRADSIPSSQRKPSAAVPLNVPNYLKPIGKGRSTGTALGSFADGVFIRSSVEKEKGGSDSKLALEPMPVAVPKNTKQNFYSAHGSPVPSTNVSRRSSLARLDMTGKKGPQRGTVEYVAPLLERRDEVEGQAGEWGQTFKEKCVRVGEGCIIGMHVLPSLLRNEGTISHAH